MAEEWPGVGQHLLDELAYSRGRLALITATPSQADGLVERLCQDLAISVARLGSSLAHLPEPPSVNEIEAACDDAIVITDIDVLFWPEVQVPAVPFLRARSRRMPTIAVWPGQIVAGRAIYSTPGRPDHYDVVLSDAVVLRALDTRFPDEVPYSTERILP
jgi:hypothetical protein